MPFGFIGSAAVLVLLGSAIPVLLAFAWPGVVGRPGPFLAVGIAGAVIVGIAFFVWHASALANVGIAGQPAAGGKVEQVFLATMRARYSWAVVGVVGAELLLCTVLRMILGRGASV